MMAVEGFETARNLLAYVHHPYMYVAMVFAFSDMHSLPSQLCCMDPMLVLDWCLQARKCTALPGHTMLHGSHEASAPNRPQTPSPQHTARYRFHQANLRTFEHGEEKATHSLLSLWLEAVGAWLQRYSTLPVYTLKQGDLAKHFRARMARDACDIRAEMRVEAGRVKAIDVRTGGARCHAKLTVTDTDGGVKLQQRDGMDVVQYGIDTTFEYVLERGYVCQQSGKVPWKHGTFE